MAAEQQSDYSLGVPESGFYQECINTNSELYGGNNMGNYGGMYTIDQALDGYAQTLRLQVPALTSLVFRCQLRKPNVIDNKVINL